MMLRLMVADVITARRTAIAIDGARAHVGMVESAAPPCTYGRAPNRQCVAGSLCVAKIVYRTITWRLASECNAQSHKHTRPRATDSRSRLAVRCNNQQLPLHPTPLQSQRIINKFVSLRAAPGYVHKMSQTQYKHTHAAHIFNG